jgi:uncharacterized protein YggE
MKKSSAIMAAMILMLPAAGRALIMQDPHCDLSETATVTWNVNDSGNDVVALRDGLNKEIDEISKLSKTAGIEKLEMQSVNYSIRTPNQFGINRRYALKNNRAEGTDEYVLSGNVTFKVQPSEKGAEFMALLVKKGYQATLGVNGFRGYNCSQSSVLPPPPPQPVP